MWMCGCASCLFVEFLGVEGVSAVLHNEYRASSFSPTAGPENARLLRSVASITFSNN